MTMILRTLGIVAGLATFAGTSLAASVSEREYKRGYEDCLRGDYDQNQHGASYKRGCRAAEDSGKSGGDSVKQQADANLMRSVCHGAVIGRFHHFVRSVRISTVEHTKAGWGIYASAVMDDGGVSEIACIFSSTGRLKRMNASEPFGGSTEMDHEGHCPNDVSEADRYKYSGCN